MCGLAGIIGHDQPDDAVLVAMRDAMTHRGPDGAGLWRTHSASLVHRRLAVVDRSDAGRQPMLDASERWAIAYNGELYNDADLRDRLAGHAAGMQFRSACDTETLLSWISAGRSLDDLRGMYAFAAIDTAGRTLTLARDPLGIKPLFWTRLPGRVVFASEIQALFEHPAIEPRPSVPGIRAYLATIRTVIDEQTMFDGVFAVPPGEVLRFDLDDPDAEPIRTSIAVQPRDGEASDDDIRDTVLASIGAHLRTDVPLCALLSGGLDSTIIATETIRRVGALRTYCSGVDGVGADAGYAREVAGALGTDHAERLVDSADFLREWQDTIGRTGLPMSTPNEVAIRLIARSLRSDGCIVALSGEGADEFFAGYDQPMRMASDHVLSGGDRPGRFQLDAHAWITPHQQQALLEPAMWSHDPDDAELESRYERLFDEAGRDVDDPLARHLRFQQRVNLVGLLQRLDSATMLESVEGRTPFADREVQAAAWSVRTDRLFDAEGGAMFERTKLALRRAFASSVPVPVLQRDKASFPLPFERWIGGVADRVLACEHASAPVLGAGVLTVLASDPQRHWNLAWPIFNLAMWADRWWGSGRSGTRQTSAASARGTAASSRLV